MDWTSWQRLTNAAEFYEASGFTYKNVPWVVAPEISAITKPVDIEDFYLGKSPLVLVGSAEQSFLQIYDSLDNGLYYAITPCFRNEYVYDELHKMYFMKLELFTKDANRLLELLDSAKAFFERHLPWYSHYPVEKVTLGVDDYDLMYRGIELGSYNIKRHGQMEWACGTGLAEPRFTQAYGKA